MYFKDIAGQEYIKKKLIRNAQSGRVSHAQLFLGPEGSGKLALAIAYARYLACEQPGDEDACGKCANCLKYNKLAHPDLNFFYPIVSKKKGDKSYCSLDYVQPWREYLSKSAYVSLNGWYTHIDMENKQGIINAEDCNQIIKLLGYKAYESKYKVIIMWMIERIYHAAAPKLLKILEEPPENTLFLLVSENHELVLPTILSRAQMIKVPHLSDDEVMKGLMDMYGVQHDLAQESAFLAEGNFYKALALSQHENLHEKNIPLLREWFRSCYAFKAKDMSKHINEIAQLGREKQKRLLSLALEIFRQCMLINYHTPQLLKLPEESRDFVQKFSGILQPDIAMQLCQEFDKAVYHVSRNANPKILFTDLSLITARIMMQAKK